MEEKTCRMIEEGTEIVCSECGVRIKDEIYFMFEEKEDLLYCPHCGKMIVK